MSRWPRSRRRLAIVAATCAIVVSACSSSSHSTITPGPSPALKKLIVAADLRPCPASSAAPVSGGLPDLTLSCLGNGPAVHLAGLTGKPSVVNIWGSWCEPCQAETKYLSQAFDRDHHKVGFLGIDTEDESDSALDFDAHVTPAVHYPSVVDEDRKAMIALHVDSPPYTVLVSSTGKIVYSKHGGFTSTSQLQAAISKYLHVAT
jgi:cytochrome c biogenesis protein CcmG, thiol:disulfide interchange protein DsbE